MSDDSGQTLVRQWTMLRAIPRSPRKVSATELADVLRDSGFDVSKRTIERDLHALSAQFPLALDDKSKPYGWSWAQDAQFEFMPRLTQPQAVALLLAKAHMCDLLPLSMSKELVPLFDGAEKTLAQSSWKEWPKRTAVVPLSLTLKSPKIQAGVLESVQSALVRRHCLTGRYRTKGNTKPREMKIHPLGLFSRGSVLYLVCTLSDYADVRQLALHRLSDVTESAERRKEPEGFDFADYMTTSASNFHTRGMERITCRFDARAAEHLRETPLSADQELIDLVDGIVQVRATVENDERLRWWLLGFGAQVTVVAPKALRDEIGAEIRRASSRYAAAEANGSES